MENFLKNCDCNIRADFRQMKFMEISRNYTREILKNFDKNDKILAGFYEKRKCFCVKQFIY